MEEDKEQEEAAKKKRRRKASTVEARENQLIALAIDLAEKKIRDGTASSQVITHYLKLGSTKERLEKKLTEKQIELTDAKIESIRTMQHEDEMYEQAIAAMKRYSGSEDIPDD